MGIKNQIWAVVLGLSRRERKERGSKKNKWLWSTLKILWSKGCKWLLIFLRWLAVGYKEITKNIWQGRGDITYLACIQFAANLATWKYFLHCWQRLFSGCVWGKRILYFFVNEENVQGKRTRGMCLARGLYQQCQCIRGWFFRNEDQNLYYCISLKGKVNWLIEMGFTGQKWAATVTPKPVTINIASETG